MEHFGDIAFGPQVEQHQRRRGSYDGYRQMRAEAVPSGLGPEERAFLVERDSFYLASTGEGGWPYVQHRGGPPGFLQVLSPTCLAWADRPGNRQFVTAGNLVHDDRVSLIAVDYPSRTRLKVLGRARWEPDPAAEELAGLGIAGRLEGLVTVQVVAFDWNCPKYITPRFTAEQVEGFTAHLTSRIAELEAQVARLEG